MNETHYYKPCSKCYNKECLFNGTNDTHELCEDFIGWIPVSERLPEKNMECLVTVGDFNLVQTAMYSNLMGLIDHRIFYQGECCDETFKNITRHVKAWMFLPEPYREDGETNDE